MSNVKEKNPPPTKGKRNWKKANVRKKVYCIHCVGHWTSGIRITFIMQVIQPIDFIELEFQFNKLIYVSCSSIWFDHVVAIGNITKKKLGSQFTSKEY